MITRTSILTCRHELYGKWTYLFYDWLFHPILRRERTKSKRRAKRIDCSLEHTISKANNSRNQAVKLSSKKQFFVKVKNQTGIGSSLWLRYVAVLCNACIAVSLATTTTTHPSQRVGCLCTVRFCFSFSHLVALRYRKIWLFRSWGMSLSQRKINICFWTAAV